MIAMIAAVAQNRVIGRKGKIPWDIPEDMKHFRELTMGKIIIMGRRTYEEIGHPLPGRFTYLISSALQVETENCCTVSSLQEALRQTVRKDVFVCGGASLYEEGMAHADILYITEIHEEVEGDVFFPKIDDKIFAEVERIEGKVDFVIYKRRN